MVRHAVTERIASWPLLPDKDALSDGRAASGGLPMRHADALDRSHPATKTDLIASGTPAMPRSTGWCPARLWQAQ